MALLVGRFGRLDLAEDALAEAFEAAVRTWPTDGAPANPPAWLLTTARRRIIDRLRTEAVATRTLPLLVVEAAVTTRAAQDAQSVAEDGEVLVDERLRLVLLATHPVLSRESAAALALRLVLGVSTADVARLFLVSTPTMAARLTRARQRLAGAEFVVPEGDDLGPRLGRVADVAYLAFTSAYAPASGDRLHRPELAAEAVRLVRVLLSVLPQQSGAADRTEVEALLALCLLHHARRDARGGADGVPVLLPDQDRSRWHHDEIVEAIGILHPLTTRPGSPYLLQALIAAEHAIARSSQETAWQRIVERYDELLLLADSPVVRLNRAVAVAELHGPEAGLSALDSVSLPGHRLPGVRAELLRRLGRPDAARAAYDQAVEACCNTAELEHLRRRRDTC